MSDQPSGSAELADILRELRLSREVRAESSIPAEVRAALGLPADPGTIETLPPATACFELHIGNMVPIVGLTAQVPVPPPQVVIPFQVTVDLVALPYAVLSGAFFFDSPVVTRWQITQESHFGLGPTTSVPAVDDLYIVGEYIDTVDVVEPAPADGLFVPPQVLIQGSPRAPLSYPGTFYSGGILYFANTLFKGWQACS